MENKKSPDSIFDPDSKIFKRLRNAVILPDGTKREPMGSGVITGLLGVGGMANVYEIWNPQLEINRAVKLLHPNYTEEAKQRFQTEIKITAKLHHPNIIEIHAVGQWNGLPFIEMERIDGYTLERIIAERGAFPIEVCTSIGILIGRALRYAHNQEYVIYGKTYHGVIHRDLKPSNIMIAKNGAVKLMDFGIARPTDASIHTTDGSILGTMQYLSPEQLDGKEAGIRSDIYSLGTIIYETITGVKAFPEANVSKLMLSKIKNDYKSLDDFDVRIPQRLRKLIQKSMSHDREKRIPDAASFLLELGRIHKSITGSSPEHILANYMNVSGVERVIVNVRRKIPWAMIAAGAAVAVAGYTAVRIIVTVSHPKPPAVATATLPELSTQPVIDKAEPAPVKLSEVKRSVVEQPKPAPVRKKKSVSDESAKIKPLPKKELSLIERLKIEYASSDILTIFMKEVKAGNYSDALSVFANLSPEEARSEKALIYKMRALNALGRAVEVQDLIQNNMINDGEFYLEKAKSYYKSGELSNAMKFLILCSKTQSIFIDAGDLRRERLYYTALCRSAEFDRDHSEPARRAALDSWYSLKEELRSNQEHRYYKKLTYEMNRLSEKVAGK